MSWLISSFGSYRKRIRVEYSFVIVKECTNFNQLQLHFATDAWLWKFWNRSHIVLNKQ